MDLLRVLSWETGAECGNARAVVRLVREDWFPQDQLDDTDDDRSGAALRASSILLLLRIITFVIHASGSVAGGMLELLDAQAEVGDSDPQADGGSAFRAVGSLVGNRECDYAADVVRLLALEAPSCSSFAEVEEALTCVPEVGSRLVAVLHKAEKDLERVRASGQLTMLADEELMDLSLSGVEQEELTELGLSGVPQQGQDPGVVEM